MLRLGGVRQGSCGEEMQVQAWTGMAVRVCRGIARCGEDWNGPAVRVRRCKDCRGQARHGSQVKVCRVMDGAVRSGKAVQASRRKEWR